ncbi:MAG: ABC transporter substrate-binding protein [Lachnospiraceae bacterium]|nr:ABC transporter substrate-binding protein [Lachnospiraceae bacterium]
MKFKKIMSLCLIIGMAASLAACGESSDSASSDSASGSSTAAVSDLPSFDALHIEDYTDLEADITILTDRTDIVDTTYAEYAAEFQGQFPGITVTYEAVTDYAEAVTLRLTNGDWGDICFIPDSVEKSELSTYFAPLGDYDTLDEIYYNMNAQTYDDTVYGIPNGGNTPGIIINKEVWAEAGIREYPTTPDEFIEALQQIKDNTDAIPLYTNFADGWPLGQWTGYIGIPTNADPDYAENIMPHQENPFAEPEDGDYGPYALFSILYDAVANDLVEEDPASTDWESSKANIGNGTIAAMVLQSWAINQCKDLAENPEVIDYIPMPITVNGVQAMLVNSNYCYGINCQSAEENQLASMVYVKWLIEESSIMEDEGNIPERKDQDLPDSLANFEGLELMTNAKEEEAGLKNTVANESEVLTDANIAKVVEGALAGTSFDEIMDDWNQKWSDAQEYAGVEVNQ